MSSITPPSFVDDGSAFEKRILNPTRWLNRTHSDTTSAYTGSYIDDGADMLLSSRHVPGFGPINPTFYKQRKRKENESAAWNDDIQKAVAGDIGRSLEKMRGIGGMGVKRADGKERRHKEQREDTVTVPLPRKWGTFVIKANDGRVIVVDEVGEFDSGAQVQHLEQQPAKWVKAPTTISHPPSSPIKSPHKHKDMKKDLEQIKSLTPISESEYEDGYIPSGGEDIMSPTGFFMTGGAHGWPSRSASPVRSRQISRRSSPLKPKSPIRSLPGSWPSPPQSPTKVSEESTTSNSTQSWGERKTYSSGKSRKSHESSRQNGNNASTKTHSTYRPATVEVAPDTSSENAPIAKQTGWDGSQKSKGNSWAASHKSSEAGWGGSKKASEHNWAGSNKSSHKSSRHSPSIANNDAWIVNPAASDHHPAPSVVQNWIGDRVKTVSEASTQNPRLRSHHDRSRSRSQKSRNHSGAPSDKSWDGYEKPKTMSEVSVAGTGSERSWPSSRAASHRNHQSHKSDKSHHSDSHWGGSEQQWRGSQTANVGGWGEDRTDSESGIGGSRHANGYDEDNETYLNDSWSGVKVRVRSRRGSANVDG